MHDYTILGDIFVMALHTKFKVLDSRPNSVYNFCTLLCDIFVVVLHTKFKVLDSRPNSVYNFCTLDMVSSACCSSNNGPVPSYKIFIYKCFILYTYFK